MSGSAGGGQEATGSLHQRERRCLQLDRRQREAAEAQRYCTHNLFLVYLTQVLLVLSLKSKYVYLSRAYLI